MRNGFIAVVWLLLIGLGIFAWLSTQDYDLSKALRFARSGQTPEATQAPEQPAPFKEPAPTATQMPAGTALPTFDIVRVEPDGTAVLAGRAAAGASVTVLVDGEAVGTAKADERGEWAIVVDKPLAVGNHNLTITSVAGEAAVNSEQSVAIAVPERKDEKPLIVLSQKGEPSKVIQTPDSVTTVQTQPQPAEPKAEEKASAQQPAEQKTAAVAPETQAVPETKAPSAPAPAVEAPAPKPAEAPAPKPAGDAKELALQTVDYDDQGNMVFQGTSAPGSTVRIYVDNQPIADAQTDTTGSWTLRVVQDIEPGNHNLRVDQLKQDAQVASRIELPFTRARPEDVIAALKEPAVEAQPAAEAAAPAVRTEPAASPGSETTSSNVVAAAPETQPGSAAPTAGQTTAVPSAAPSTSVAETTPATTPSPAASTEKAPETTMAKAPEPATAEAPASASPAAPAEQPAAPTITAEPAPAAPAAASGGTETAAATATAPAPSPAPVTGDASTPGPAAPAAGAAPTAAKVTAPPPPAPPVTAAAPSQPPAQAPAAATPSTQQTVATAEPSPATPRPGSAEAPASPSPSSPVPSPAVEAPAAPAATQEAPATVAAAAPGATKTTRDGTTVLQRTGRVIIQPGNNLWNISRVIYGQGISYTTIYSANKDQIRDPDRIYPGQIFRTPGVMPPEQIAPDRREPLAAGENNG